MAIGLGRMLGFRFRENFNYPYVARSITDFWRRWHISLSTWFRDYVYFPLGGSRRGALRTSRNLLVVFLLCGLWHGASWTFVLWGLYHGAFLALERLRFVSFFQTLPRPAVLRHVYVLLVVMVGWVFFRATSGEHAAAYLRALVGIGQPAVAFYDARHFLDARLALVLVAGVIACTPVLAPIAAWRRGLDSTRVRFAGEALTLLVLAALLLASSLELAAGTHDPFIYYRF